VTGRDRLRVALVDPASALPVYVDRLARGLAAAGAEVLQVCAPSPYRSLPAPEGFRRELAFARWLAAPALAPLGRSAATRRAARAASYLLDWARLERRLGALGVDVVHLQWSLDARCDAWWLRRLRRRGVGVVVTFHNARARADAPGRHGGEGRLLAAADAIVTLGATVAGELARRFPARAPCFAVIPPSVPAPEPERISQAEARRRWGLPADAAVALFFGLVRPYKGVDRLTAAFATVARSLPAARLVVAGRGRESFAPLAGQLAAAGLGDRLLRVDRYVDEREAGELFAASDLVALPYRVGSASAVVVEAWRHERLPLASAIGALGEQVIDGETGCALPPEEDAALVRALAERLADRGGTLAAGRCAAEAARRRFPPEQEAAKHLALYRGSGRPARAA